MMKDILIFVADLIVALTIIGLVLYGEYSLLYPLMQYCIEWLFIILILSFFGLAWLNGKFIKILLPNFGKVKNPNYKDGDNTPNVNDA